MKISLVLLQLLLYFTLIDARYLFKKREHGNEYLGRSYVVMEGDDLKMPCHSRPKHGKYSLWSFFWQVLPRKIGKVWYNTLNLVSQYPMGKPFSAQRFRPSKYSINAKLIPNTRKLFISNITRNAAGKYRCVVISKTESGKMYIEITYYSVVVKAPARIISSTKTPIYLNAGDKLELQCVSTGNPVPEVRWTLHDNVPLLHDRTFQQSWGTLLVKHVRQTDVGIYTCNASNVYGSDVRQFIVDINVPARITTEAIIAYGAVGEDSQIQCEAVGKPQPTFVWKWKSGHELMYLNEVMRKRTRINTKIFHRHDSSVSILNIPATQSSDFRQYICSAKNIHGFSKIYIDLKEYSVPDAPVILGVSTFGTKVDVFWKYENDGGKYINTAVIEYSVTKGHEWKNITIGNPSTPRCTLRNLLPRTKYKIRLVVGNEIGRSLHSAMHKVRTGAILRPEPPRIEGVIACYNNVNITWSLAKNKTETRKIGMIIIEYAETGAKDWTRILVKNLNTGSYSMTNLRAKTDYKFRLSAKNEFGKSVPTPVHRIKTGAVNPSLKSEELRLNWSYPENFRRRIRTLVVSYVITNSDGWKNITIQDPNVTYHVIKKLHSTTEYMVQVFAIDNETETLYSSVRHVTIGLVSSDNHGCNVRVSRDSSALINIALEYKTSTTNITKPSHTIDNQPREWSHIVIILAVTAVLEIMIVMVWIWRQEKRNACIVEQLKGTKIETSDKDRETVL